MQVFRFDSGTTQPLTAYGSHGASITHLLRMPAGAFAVCIRLEPGGVLAEHPALQDQVFLVVGGAGTVRSGEHVEAIQHGEAAFWQAGEYHETRSETGLAAIVIEGKGLDPAALLPARDNEE